MKKGKKKYNPLKKYKDGGKPGKMTRQEMQEMLSAFEKKMDNAEQPEDLMKGRTFIPRMSTSQKTSLLMGAKDLMEKRKDKKLFMEEGGTKKEYRGLRKEMLENKKRKDLGLDIDKEEMDSFKVEGVEEERVDVPALQIPGSTTSKSVRNPELKYGGKILKKYSKKKKSKR